LDAQGRFLNGGCVFGMPMVVFGTGMSFLDAHGRFWNGDYTFWMPRVVFGQGMCFWGFGQGMCFLGALVPPQGSSPKTIMHKRERLCPTLLGPYSQDSLTPKIDDR